MRLSKKTLFAEQISSEVDWEINHQNISTPIGVIIFKPQSWELTYTSPDHNNIPTAILYLGRIYCDRTDNDVLSFGVTSTWQENGDLLHEIKILKFF